MVTKEDILEALPSTHGAVIQMVLETEPKTWDDVILALDWISFSVELAARTAKKLDR